MAKPEAGDRGSAPDQRSGLPFFLYGPLGRFLGAAVLGLVPLILGYIGLREYLSGPHAPTEYGHGWWDLLFYDLQLPLLASAPTQGAGPYPVPLGIARLLAPSVAGLAVVGTLWLLLGEQWRRWLAATAQGHSVVAGDGAVARELARRLREENRKVVLASASDETLAQARRSGVLAIHGNPDDPGTLRAAGVAGAAELYACTPEGVANAVIALTAREGLPAGRKQPLAAYALVRDVDLGVALRARRIGVAGDSRLRLDFFDVEGMAARKLLDEHPVRASVVIAGFGRLGQAILREVARRHLPLPGRNPVSVLITCVAEADVPAATAASAAAGAGLGSGGCSVRYEPAPQLPAAGECTVFVCVDGTDDGLRVGLDMVHSLAGTASRVVICMRESAPLADVLSWRSGLIDDAVAKISVFGVIQKTCVPADIRDDFTERLARAIHGSYVAGEAAKGTAATNPSAVPWERLPADLRQSNIAQATDIGTKLNTIGAVVIPDSAGVSEFTFTAQEVELLSRLEHARWMKERTEGGWRFGEQRDNAGKLHPDLRDWTYLSDEAKDKDRNAIRALPGTLRDAGFQILRLPKDA